jgi:hypothetical protein
MSSVGMWCGFAAPHTYLERKFVVLNGGHLWGGEGTWFPHDPFWGGVYGGFGVAETTMEPFRGEFAGQKPRKLL